MSGIQEAQSAFGGLGDVIKGSAIGKLAADAIEGAASGIVDFGKAAMQTGMSFDQSMANVAAISGSTGETLDALRDKAKEMGASTKFTATEAADAFSYMAMAGWDAEQMMDGISGIMNLAAASGEDLATTSDIVTDALTAFGLKAEDSGHFADVLAAASSNANTNVGMMGETFKYVAPVAGALGYSVEDVAAAIGTMANSGIKSSQAGTALRGALTKLIKPSDEAAAAMKALGLYDLAEGAENFQADLTQLEDEMRAVDEKTVALEKAQTKYNTAVEKYGATSTQATEALRGVDKATYNLQKAEAKLQEGKDAQMRQQYEYNTLLQDSEGNMLPFSETIEALRNAFSGMSDAEKTETAALVFGQEAMSGMLAIINTAPEDYDALASTIAASSDAMGGMGTAAEMAAVQLDNFPGQVTILQSAFDGFKTAVYEKIKAPLKELATTGADVFSRLTTAVNEGGIMGAFEALGGIIFDTIGPKFAELTDKILPGVSEGFAGIGDALQPFADTVTGAFSEALTAVTGAVQSFLDTFRGADVSGVIETVAAGAKDLLSAFAGAAADVVEGISTAVGSFMDAFDNDTVSAIITSIANGAKNLFAAFGSAKADLITAAGSSIRGFLDAFAESDIANIIAEIAKNAASFFGVIASVAANVISDTASAIKTFLDGFDKKSAVGVVEALADGVGILFGFFTESLGGIIKSVGEAFSGFGDKLAELWNKAGPSMKETGEAVRGVIENIRVSVADFLKFVQPVIEWLTSVLSVTVQLAFEQLVVAVGAAWNAIMNVVTAMQDAFGGFVALLHGDVAGAAEKFKAAWENIVDFFKNIADFIVGPFKVIPQLLGDEGNKGVAAIKAPFEAAWEWFKGVGGNIVAGLKQGIADAWSSLTSYVSDKFSGLISGVMNIFGEHSPSKVFAGIGENLILGLRQGWGAEFGGLESQVDRDMKTLTGTARIGFEDSAIGRSSAAGISSMFAANETSGRGDPVSINLVLDGDVAATALYDPLRRTAFQKGQGKEAAYA